MLDDSPARVWYRKGTFFIGAKFIYFFHFKFVMLSAPKDATGYPFFHFSIRIVFVIFFDPLREKFTPLIRYEAL